MSHNVQNFLNVIFQFGYCNLIDKHTGVVNTYANTIDNKTRNIKRESSTHRYIYIYIPKCCERGVTKILQKKCCRSLPCFHYSKKVKTPEKEIDT